ncbi:hypothetical protein NL676_032591 [Syzygium grande]|nr:hypothetical protein NL676_032591 [Syzygium grande]
MSPYSDCCPGHPLQHPNVLDGADPSTQLRLTLRILMKPSLLLCCLAGLEGPVPANVDRRMSALKYLDVSSNSLSGDLPSSVSRLKNLVYLDLSNNALSGDIYAGWTVMPKLKILDLSKNNFSGMKSLEPYYELPPEFRSFYSGSIELNMKGRSMEYNELIPLVNMIDLSINNLSGEIPPEISNLSTLKALILSNNQLTGSIPSNISGLKQLETLDLSFNRLSGQIPPGMSSLTSLSCLNLSYNNLDGTIHRHGQLQTFGTRSFEGNPGLCMFPLSRDCLIPTGWDGQYDDGKDKGNKIDDQIWFCISIILGFVVGFWSVCGTLVIKTSWRQAYFSFIDKMKEKLYLVIQLNTARLRRNLENRT